jgi:hypothetical protein
MGNMPYAPRSAARTLHSQAAAAHATFVAGPTGNHCAPIARHTVATGKEYFRSFQVSVGVSTRLSDW